MPYLPSKNLLFIHIPKTGGSSIEYSLGVHPTQLGDDCSLRLSGTPKHLQHLTLHQIETAYNLPLLDIHCFAVVRNPLDRVVSEYKWRKAIGSPIVQDLTFAEFINLLYRRFKSQELSNDPHFRPQSEFIYRSSICKTFKLFRLEDGMKLVEAYLTGILGNEIRIEHKNKSSNQHHPPSIPDSCLEIVHEIYASDFELHAIP